MKNKDIDNLENILLDLEDVENGAMISLSQEEINSLESILEYLKSSISKDKIKEKIKDYTEKSKHPLVNSQSRSEYTFALKVLKELLEEN